MKFTDEQLNRSYFGIPNLKPNDRFEQYKQAARQQAREDYSGIMKKERKDLAKQWNELEKINRNQQKDDWEHRRRWEEENNTPYRNRPGREADEYDYSGKSLFGKPGSVDEMVASASAPPQTPPPTKKPLVPEIPSNNLTRGQQFFRGTANLLDGITLSRFFGGDGLSRELNEHFGNEWTNKALSNDVNGQIKAADFVTDLLSPTLPMGTAYKAVDKGMDLTRAVMNPKASQLALNAKYGKGGDLSKQAWSETAGIGALAGLTYNVGENTMAGIGPGGDQRSIQERLLNTSLEAGLGAGGDVAVRGIGKLLSPKLKQLTDRYDKGEIDQKQFDEVVNSDPELKEEILLLPEGQKALPEPIYQTKAKYKVNESGVDVPEGLALPEPPTQPLTNKVNDLQAQLQSSGKTLDEFNQAVDEQFQYLKQSMDNRQGVSQGTIGDGVGNNREVTGAYRYSENPGWYQDFFKKHGRKPNNTELRALAEEHVLKGFNDESMNVPPYQPKQADDIDNQISELTKYLEENPEYKEALEPTLNKLKQEKIEPIQEFQNVAKANKELSTSKEKLDYLTEKLYPKQEGAPLSYKKEMYNPLEQEPISYTGKIEPMNTTKAEYSAPRINDNLLNSLEYGDKIKVRNGRSEVELTFVKREGNQVVVKRKSGKETVIPAEMVNSKAGDPFSYLNISAKETAATVTEPPLSKLSNPKKSSESIGKQYEAVSPQKEVPLQKLDERLIPKNPNPKIDNPADLVKKKIDVDGKREKSKWSFDKFYTSMIDDLRPLDKATKELGGKKLKSSENPYIQARLSRGVAGKAETFLKGGVYKDGKKIGKSLEEIVKPIEDHMDDFLAYSVSKRTLDYDDKGLVAGIRPKDVEDFTDRQLAEATIKQLEEKHPNFKEAHEEIVKYSQRLMNEVAESGYYTKEQVEKMFENNMNYVPMNRVQDPKVRGFEPLYPKNRYANLSDPTKKRTGSERPIINPVESLVKNTYLLLNVAERNKVGNQLYNLLENAGDNAWGRVISKKKNNTDLHATLDEAHAQLDDGKADAIDNLFKGEGNKVYAYKDGEKVEMELQEDLYKAMLSLDAQKQNFFIKMLAVPTRALRTGAVLSPDFGPVNIFRDQFSAYVNSKYGFKPFVDMARGMASVIKKDDVYWEWMNNGGANSVLSTLDREYLQQDIRRLVKQSMGQRVKAAVKQPIRTVLEPLRKVSEMTEEATRLGEYKKGLKKGATPQEAAFASRDLIDFSRAGNLGRQYNQITAFFNAAVQSLDKTARVFKENPKGASVRAAMGITMPSIAAYMFNHDQEWYKDLPQREKDLFWHFKQGETLYKVPKPFEIGVLFGTVPERFAEYLKTNDPAAFKDLENTVKDTFTPPWLPTALTPWIEVFANKSTYFDSPIVPRREEGLLPEDQYGPYTSELSKEIGDALKVSPRKVDHVIKGYTGGLGKYGLQIGDYAAKTIGGKERPELPDKGMGGLPIVNRFVVQNLEGNNQPISDFYDNMDRLRRERLSAKKNNVEYGQEQTYQLFNKLSKEVSELQASKREIIATDKLNGKEKTAQIKKLDQLITQLAKVGLQNVGR